MRSRSEGRATSAHRLAGFVPPLLRTTLNQAFTLVELMVGASIMVIALTALMGAFLGQSFLNTNAMNLTLAMNDATRVMEQIRMQAMVGGGPGCNSHPPFPPAKPTNFNSWDDWLTSQGKSIPAVDGIQFERVVVTCQTEDGSQYCGDHPGGSTPAQVGSGEWRTQHNAQTSYNPIRVTVAVGWRQSQWVIGAAPTNRQEFTYTRGATQLGVQDANNNGVIESQAMLTMLITCR